MFPFLALAAGLLFFGLGGSDDDAAAPASTPRRARASGSSTAAGVRAREEREAAALGIGVDLYRDLLLWARSRLHLSALINQSSTMGPAARARAWVRAVRSPSADLEALNDELRLMRRDGYHFAAQYLELQGARE